MRQYKTDVAVLVIFFNREITLKPVVEQIKKARPSKLFLYQDGPRMNRLDDIENIARCRALFDGINWECEVHTCYQEKNVGCDPSVYNAIRWMFNYVDRGIIIEDDVVPAESFFPFCKELLDRYEDNPQIHMIAGMNRLESYPKNTEYDYMFTKSSSIWGWATWKRVVDTWDGEYTWMDDPDKVNEIRAAFDELPRGKKYCSPRVNFKYFMKDCVRHRNTGKAHFETIQAASKFFGKRICIVPTRNLIQNVGVIGESTHCTSSLRNYPAKYQQLFTMKRFEVSFPINHPTDMTVDKDYIYLCEKVLGTHRITRLVRMMETKVRSMFCRG